MKDAGGRTHYFVVQLPQNHRILTSHPIDVFIVVVVVVSIVVTWLYIVPRFKETSAQHFFSHSGDGSWETFNREAGDACWTPDAERPTPNFDNQTCNPRLLVRTCVPTPDGTNWRNEVVSEIIEKGKLHQIRVLKWFEYTLPRWDLHEDQRNISIAWKGQQAGVSADCGNRNNITGRYESKCLLPNLGGQDCTHFSYTPFLYEPMWDEIAEAMAARWGVDVRANV